MAKGILRTSILKPEIPAYLTKPIGQIIVKWSYLEYRLSTVIWQILGVSDEVGRLAVSDPRAQQKFELIRDLLHLRGHEMAEKNYTGMYTAIEAVQGIRDVAAHGVWTFEDGIWHVLKFSGKIEDQTVHKVRRKRRYKPEGLEASATGLAPVIQQINNLIMAVDEIEKIVASLGKAQKQSGAAGRKSPARKNAKRPRQRKSSPRSK